MKIAVWYNLPSGGGKRSLYNHVKMLLELGHTVEVWTTDIAIQHNYLSLHELCPEHILPVAEKIKPFTNSRFAWRQIRSTNRKIQIMKAHCEECATQIHAGDFDVCFVNPCCLFYMSFMGLYLKMPKVMYLQEPNRLLYETKNTYHFSAQAPFFSIKSWHEHIKLYGSSILAYEEHEAAKSYDKILVNSIFSRESIIRAYGIDAQVCYLGTDMDHFKPTRLHKKAYVVGLGFVYHGKGLDRAVQALATIPELRRPELIWIGNSQDKLYADEVKKLANDLKVKLEIKVAIPDEELFKIISQAAVMLYTSRLEPFGFAPIEANALGTGVVAIAEGGVKETVKEGENGFLVYHNDSKSLGQLVEKFTLDLDFSQRFGQEARILVLDRWGLKKMGISLEMHLQTVVNLNNN
jgi:glycosyltransferase involved in cell wall biosynthesis